MGVRSESNGRFTGWSGKGIGAVPTVIGVARSKAVVDLYGQPLGDSGASLQGDRDDSGDVGQRLHAGAQQSNR
jgi:hypothetical protein